MEFIPQVEPYISKGEIKAVVEYLKSGGWLTEFKKTEEFEERICELLNIDYAVVVTSGTAALYLSLLACGISKGDKVIVPNFTMIATPNAVKWTGADVILVDIEKDTLCLDIKKIEKIDRSVKALIYVSLNGRSGNMDKVVKFCYENDIILIEDSCQAFMSTWNNKYLGTFGIIGVYSLTPHKLITTGQGGIIVTNDESIYKKIKKLKDFCRVKPGVDLHEDIGYNFKFTDLQAVIGLEQLKSIKWRVKRKKEIYKFYYNSLKNVEEIKFIPTDLNQTVPWFIDILVEESIRDELINYLKTKNIGSRPFYPAINTQKPYKVYKGHFDISNTISKQGLWLPSSLGLKYEELDYIVNNVRNFFSHRH
ncbi:putative pyridoxal phosphate-dependent enzyme apparently involved in regulation of cell wall biogenesis [Archaeoglobus sulfaticallidus PM70-1]|uniref:Putative pyridoxal phosphate-dependent enzyme apparently involved in regulation of cell wall biogenesis n=1 Tax=Archaeoglobus sulfaticallidus PM70-1 TaxID=387631 RepID=N0BIW0_9EURY|nr:DegT/DnrJ/EryC1/StrS family aminotransferase [Archaeoglobus sulfaticallidus]AGK60075.1 putative pyridoxal phosphate-dependent enzyme apparently involved in regulation of cell wall biogenesis [Archaeoglobus sulfaticallidus PM70-1]